MERNSEKHRGKKVVASLLMRANWQKKIDCASPRSCLYTLIKSDKIFIKQQIKSWND